MKKIAFDYGLKMYLGFVLLFLVVHLLGWSENYYLRVINGLIHFAIIFLSVRQYRRTFPESLNNYLTGVSAGIYTSMVGVILFTVSMFLFLTFFDPAFFQELKAQAPFPQYFTPFTACLFIFVEGVVVSLIGSYMITRVIDDNIENVPFQERNV